MLASRRWRDWRPSEIRLESRELEAPEPPKLASVSSVSCNLGPSQRIAPSEEIPPHDPAEWREPLIRWVGSVCMSDPRCWGGVGSLHLAFCEWAIAQCDVPCTRFVFECLLRELGFEIDEIAGVVLVDGLTFREDFESAGLRHGGRFGQLIQPKRARA